MVEINASGNKVKLSILIIVVSGRWYVENQRDSFLLEDFSNHPWVYGLNINCYSDSGQPIICLKVTFVL